MKIYLYMSEGGGCDYTIGCGSRLVELRVADPTDHRAVDKAVKETLERYGVSELTECVVLSFVEDVMRHVDARRAAKQAREAAALQKKKEEEFERLKKELGK